MRFKFPWSKPSAKEVIEEIFSGFTPEELAILESDEYGFPRMYSEFLGSAQYLRTRRTMKEIKELAQAEIYPLRKKDLRDTIVQWQIKNVLIYGIFCEREYIY